MRFVITQSLHIPSNFYTDFLDAIHHYAFSDPTIQDLTSQYSENNANHFNNDQMGLKERKNKRFYLKKIRTDNSQFAKIFSVIFPRADCASITYISNGRIDFRWRGDDYYIFSLFSPHREKIYTRRLWGV